MLGADSTMVPVGAVVAGPMKLPAGVPGGPRDPHGGHGGGLGERESSGP